MTATIRIIVFARYPVPGEAKTRLIPALGPAGAAALHRRLVERTLERLAPLGPTLAHTGAEEAAFRAWLGDSAPLVPQAEGGLGARMLAAMEGGRAVLVGSDVPDIDLHVVAEAVALLTRHDLVIGPAEDGGYWLIGTRTAQPRLFDGVIWGGADVRRRTEANAAALGLRVAHAATLADLDRPEDLARWPDLLDAER